MFVFSFVSDDHALKNLLWTIFKIAMSSIPEKYLVEVHTTERTATRLSRPACRYFLFFVDVPFQRGQLH